MARTSLARPAQIFTLTLIPRDLNSNPDLNSVLTLTPTLTLVDYVYPREPARWSSYYKYN